MIRPAVMPACTAMLLLLFGLLVMAAIQLRPAARPAILAFHGHGQRCSSCH